MPEANPLAPALAGGIDLGPRFEVRGLLGAGGMGVVYDAFDRDRQLRVAVKMLRDPLRSDAALLLKAEFRAARDVHHPNLVTLYDLAEHDGRWFFTMELVGGVDLLDYVARRSPRRERGAETQTEPRSRIVTARVTAPLDAPGEPASGPRVVAPIAPYCDEARLRASLRQLARGLLALHRHDRVHRDVKPGNVRVTDDGRVVLLDLGLAIAPSRGGSGPDAGDVVGTVLYMAPEQAAGRGVGPAADWYAVGALLYEALAGVPPFRGRAFEVANDKQHRDPPPPRTLAPDAPADLDALCTALLAREPAARPTGHEVIERLSERRKSRVVPLRPAGLPPFVGRDRELAALRNGLDDARRGHAAIVLCHGEAGVGKTALVRHFLDTVAIPVGAVVLDGRCHERELLPFRTVDGLVDALCAFSRRRPAAELIPILPDDLGLVAEAFPQVRTLGIAAPARPPRRARDPVERRGRLVAALRQWVVRVARQNLLVLFVDDLHWADADGLAALSEILRPPDTPALLFLGTLRQQGTHLRAGGGGSGLTVAAPRSLTDVAALLGPEARTLAVDPLPEAVARRLTRTLRARGGDDGAAFVDVAGEGALGAIAQRFAALDAPAREVLQLAAVSAVPLTVPLAADAAGIALEVAEHAAEVLRLAHLARVARLHGGSGLEPAHGLVRDAVRRTLDPVAHRAAHERLALALARATPPYAESVGMHWLEAGAPERAREPLLAAARQSMASLAFERAARLHRLVLAHAPPADASERVSLRIALADALGCAGRGAEAGEALLEAADEAEARDRGQALALRRRAAERLLCAGEVERGTRVLDGVLAAVGLRGPRTRVGTMAGLGLRRLQVTARGFACRVRREADVPAERLAAIDTCWSAAVGLGMIDLPRGAYFQARHLLLALKEGEPVRLARALALEGPFQAARGRAGEQAAARLVEMAEALGQATGDPHALGLAASCAGLTAIQQGRWRAGRLFGERAEATFRDRCTSVPWELTTTRIATAWCLAELGELRALSAKVALVLRDADERGDLYARTNASIGLCTLGWLADDDPETARTRAEDAGRLWPASGHHIQHAFALLSLALVDLYEDDGPAAHERVEAAWPALRRSGLLFNQLVRIRLREIRARAALAAATARGGDARLVSLARAEAERICREERAWADPLARRLEARIALASGDPATAAARYAAAAVGFESAEMRLAAAAATHRRAAVVGGDAARIAALQARALLCAQGVRNPDAMVRMECG